MLKELIKLSLTGWNVFLDGSSKQKFIAYAIIGAIGGGTRVFYETASGNWKKQKEEDLKRQEEMVEKLEKFKVDVTNDFRKQAKEAFEETDNNIKQAKETQSEIEKLLKELDD